LDFYQGLLYVPLQDFGLRVFVVHLQHFDFRVLFVPLEYYPNVKLVALDLY
jgi:hypothetical protein